MLPVLYLDESVIRLLNSLCVLVGGRVCAKRSIRKGLCRKSTLLLSLSLFRNPVSLMRSTILTRLSNVTYVCWLGLVCSLTCLVHASALPLSLAPQAPQAEEPKRQGRHRETERPFPSLATSWARLHSRPCSDQAARANLCWAAVSHVKKTFWLGHKL